MMALLKWRCAVCLFSKLAHPERCQRRVSASWAESLLPGFLSFMKLFPLNSSLSLHDMSHTSEEYELVENGV